MKKLSLFILLVSLVCCVGLFAACDTETPPPQDPCAAGHTEVVDATVPATCLEAGLTEGSHCSVCNKILTAQKPIPLTSHTAGDWSVQIAPTCTTQGVQQKTCTVCNTVLSTQTVAATGHDLGDWVVVTPATCSQKGEQVRSCSVCEEKQTRETNTTGHYYIKPVINIPETCTSAGYKQSACTYCNVLNTLTVKEPKGHEWPQDWEVSVQPTCAKKGEQIRKCLNCPETQTEELDKTEHTKSTWITDVAATCTTQGSRHKECTMCGIVMESELTSKRSHSYVETTLLEPTCTTAGTKVEICAYCLTQKSPKDIPASGHTESEWLVDVAPTCLTDGSHHKVCLVCEVITKTETVTALGHNNRDWQTLTPATCLQTGERAKICIRCGEGTREIIPMAPHVESGWIVDVASTCTTQGTRHKECLSCHSIMSTDVVATSAHVTDQWTVKTMPTATTQGQSVLLCLTCGATTQTAANTLVDDGTVRLSHTATLSLNGYSVVYKSSAAMPDLFSTHLSRFTAALRKATGISYTPKTDAVAIGAKEILIGLTNRPESQKAYASIKGEGFTIRTVGDKIVIVGTNDWMTFAAMQYFIYHDLGGSATLTMSVDLTAANLTAMNLASTAGSNFVFVMDNELDNNPYHMYVGGSNGDGRDFPSFLFERLIERIAKDNALGTASLLQIVDTNKTYLNGYEVLFGEIDRDESRAFRALLAADEYGYCITGKKLVIAAHTDAGLEKALEAFLSFYDTLLQTNGGILPQGYTYKEKLTGTNWITDFPQPEGVTIYNAQNNNDDAIQIIYTGANATASGYLAYCQKLVSAGYTLVANTQYDNVGGTGNYFRIYKNSKNMLYVAFTAFAAQEDYADVFATEENKGTQFGDFIHYSKPDGDNVYYPMRTYEACIRVVSAPTATAYLPDAKLLAQQSYTKICNSSITTVRLVGSSVGMCYILQLEDGRFVIVDGGNYVADNYDREILYHTLTELHKRATGSAPSTSKPIHIAAWLITHSHGDHYANMTAFLKKYVPTNLVKMDYLLGNFPELSTIYPVGGDTTTMGSGRIATLQGYFTSAGLTPFKYVKVHTGMALYFANLKMEIVMTYEDHAPFRINNSNDTNTVTKWTIASTDATSGSISASTVTNDPTKTTWMMLGDSCIYASRWMCAMWGGSYNSTTKLYNGSYLQTDMMQLAHHGNIGCEVALYKTIQPTVIWFPHNSNSYNSYTQNGTATWQRNVDSYAINTLPSVKYIVVSGMYSSAYTNSVTIGFNGSGIYFPTSGNPAWGIKYNSASDTYTTANIAYNSSSYGTKVYNSPVIKK